MISNTEIISHRKVDVHLSDVDHSYIRYANVWEDTDVLIQGLQGLKGKNVLSIASAGDNALALLAHDPMLVVAADVNIAQLHLVELKMEAIRSLDYQEYISFAGFRPHPDRVKCYTQLASRLSDECHEFWNTRTEQIQTGICHAGKFERYLSTFAKKVLPLIHNNDKVDQLFSFKSAEDQEDFYFNKWNTLRWKFLFKLFFSKTVMGLIGRDPSFLKEVEVGVAENLKKKVDNHLSQVSSQSNSFLHYCLKGHFGNHLPYFAQNEGRYNRVRKNLHLLKLENNFIQFAANNYGSFDRFNLSNIFEYMDEETFDETVGQLISIANPNAIFAYWNLMVPRRMSSVEKQISAIFSNEVADRQDRGFFYDQFITERLLR